MLLTVSLPEKWGYCAGGGRGLESSRRENNIINQDVCTPQLLTWHFSVSIQPRVPTIPRQPSHHPPSPPTHACIGVFNGARCPGRWVSQFEASHYMLPGFCRANKTIRNFLACKCRMLPPRCSRQSLRTVLWMGCKNFIMLPSLLIAIQHYNMMNVAGKDYCIISNSNRFDDEKSELYCLRIYTMSWISVTAE